MKFRLPPLSGLRAFEAASRHENFARAADELCVSHSAISQHIRALEAFLQVKLFVRLGNRVALTEEGRALKPGIGDAFAIMDEACASTSRVKHEQSIKVAAEPAFTTRWLRPRLAAFRAANPDIDVFLTAGWNPGSTQAAKPDIVIHFESWLDQPDYLVERLFPIDGYPACAPAFLEKHGQMSAPSSLENLPLIHDNSRMIWRRWFNEFLPGSDAWQHGYVYTDLSLAIDAALDGEGVFLADDILCAHEMEAGTLVRALPDTMRCAWYCIARSDKSRSDALIDRFCEWVTSSLNR